jgi:hypothetical protein
MTGPWEDYKQSEGAPWEDYSAPAPQSTWQNVKDAARVTAQGATFNMSDEAIGAGRYIWDKVFGHGRSYTDLRDEERAQVERFKEQNPKLGLALEIAGGFAVPGLGTAKAVATATRAAASSGRAAQVAAGGAALSGAGAIGGSLSGAGAAKEMADVPREALHGAAFGAVAAPIVGAVAAPAAHAVKKAASAAGNVMGALTGVGREAWGARKGAQALYDDGIRSGSDYTNALSRAQVPGRPAPTALEVGGEETAALARTLAADNRVPRATIMDAVNAQTAGQNPAVAERIADQMNLPQTQRVGSSIVADARAVNDARAADLYPRIRQRNEFVDLPARHSTDLAENPAVRRALTRVTRDLRSANRLTPEEGNNIARLLAGENARLSDNVMEGTLAKLSDLAHKSEGIEQQGYKTAQRMLERRYGPQIPTVLSVRHGDAAERARIEALEQGARFLQRSDGEAQRAAASAYDSMRAPPLPTNASPHAARQHAQMATQAQSNQQAFQEGMAHSLFNRVKGGDVKAIQEAADLFSNPTSAPFMERVLGKQTFEEMGRDLANEARKATAYAESASVARNRPYDTSNAASVLGRLWVRYKMAPSVVVGDMLRLTGGESPSRLQAMARLLMTPGHEAAIGGSLDRYARTQRDDYLSPLNRALIGLLSGGGQVGAQQYATNVGY